jgi:glycosyltransferase involved in cell wall biosynthesis
MENGSNPIRTAPSSNHAPAPDFPLPLLSCVMPTKGRPAFVAQAIRYFQRQDYGRTELLIAYERESDLPGRVDDPRVIYIMTPPGSTRGAKRNVAVQHAAGTLIAQWNDDDWYAPNRLSAQAEPILRGAADICGLNDTLFLSMLEGTCWRASTELFDRMFVENVHAGTLVYRRTVWQSLARYPATSLHDDAEFVVAAMRQGAPLCRLPGKQLFAYVRHGSNSWRLDAGGYLQDPDWSRANLPALLNVDAAFYGSAMVCNRATAMSAHAIATLLKAERSAAAKAANELAKVPGTTN